MKHFFNKSRWKAPQNGAEPTRFFVHIPKTAGTSFRAAVESRFGRSRVLRDYGLDSEATSKSVITEVYRGNDPGGIGRAILQNRAVLLTGHVPVTKYGEQVGLAGTIAIFRDPVQQVISHFKHAVRDQEYRGDLLAFAKQDRVRNLQSRLMSGIDPALLGIAGLTEKYRETLAILDYRWQWDLRHVKKNVSGRLRLRAFEVDEDTRTRLERLNQSDRALYERARLVFHNSLYCMEHRIESEPRGAITRADVRSGLQGWALETNSDKPAEIDIFVNGRIHSRASCDRQEPGLPAWGGLPRQGRLGFRVENVALRDCDSVEIRDARHGLVLANHRVQNDGTSRF